MTIQFEPGRSKWVLNGIDLTRSNPVLNPQTRNTVKLPLLVSHQYQSQGAGVSGDHHVVGSNQFAGLCGIGLV